MRSDSQLAFVPIGTPLSIVAGAGVDVASTVIDLLGVGVGVAPPSIIGNVSVFGTDFGIGGDRPLLDVVVGTAFTTSNAATLNVAMQAAADDGTYNPGSYSTLVETGEIAVSSLTANARIARFDWPPAWPEGLRPRFVRLLFQIPAGTNMDTGTIAFALVTTARDDQANKYAAKNFVAA